MTTPIEQARSAATVILLTAARIVGTYAQEKNWSHPQRGLTVPALKFGDFLRDVIDAERAVNAVKDQLIDAKRDDQIVRLGSICERTAHQVAVRITRQVGSAIWLNLWLVGEDDAPSGTALEPWPIDGLMSDRHLLEFRERWPDICGALSKISLSGIEEILPLILLEARRAHQIELGTDSVNANEQLSELPAEIPAFGTGLFEEESDVEENATIEQLPELLIVESEWTGWIEKKRLWAHFKDTGLEYSPSGWTTLIKRLVKQQVAIDDEPGRGKRTIRVRLSYFKTRGIPCP